MNTTQPIWTKWTLVWGVILFCGIGSVVAQPLSITPIGRFNFSGPAPDGMSGITYAGGNQYYAVEDSGARLHPLTIDINRATGAVNSATVGTMIQLSGTDLEGVAYNAASNSVYVSDETGADIREYNLSGTQIGTVSVPAIYNNIRANKSLESLTLQAGNQAMWTANEQALTVDGPASSTGNSTRVRLQKFNSNLNPAGQWSYVTNNAPSGFPSNAGEQVGVVDMLALPNGKVLVLERRADAFFAGFLDPSLRYDNFIYEVDFTGATDVSGFADLTSGGFTDVGKTKLWESPWFEGGARNNFEGMTLGPKLDDGDFSILLISDGDESGGFAVGESIYALHLEGTIPEPTSLAVLGIITSLLITRRRRHV